MTSDNDNGVFPKALREVWEWKEAVWEDVHALPFEEAVQVIARKARDTTAKFGFHAVPSPARPSCVAETGVDYGTECKGNSL